MTLEDRASSFKALGYKLKHLTQDELEDIKLGAVNNNPWFTEENTLNALEGVKVLLEETNLDNWIQKYSIRDQHKKVGIVMAGNIPFVGFHDLLAVVMSGNIAMVKLSSKDEFLMSYIIKMLIELSPAIEAYINPVEQLKEIDAVIATGSDNSSRYFEHYFSKYPHIIRKNRTSVAILTGKETPSELKKLGEDIFQYFGLGCRNVSKLFVPESMELTKVLSALEDFSTVIHHHKYSNNYDYHKSIFLVNREEHLDNGSVLLKKSEDLVSPISVLYYETYQDDNHLKEKLKELAPKIQCIIGNHTLSTVAFGKAQCPTVFDYADNVDTMDFLTSL